MGRKPKAEETNVLNACEHYRELAGLSRQQLADEVGVHYQTIGYIERGEYSPSLVLALRISKTLDVNLENLFWLEEPND